MQFVVYFVNLNVFYLKGPLGSDGAAERKTAYGNGKGRLRVNSVSAARGAALACKSPERVRQHTLSHG